MIGNDSVNYRETHSRTVSELSGREVRIKYAIHVFSGYAVPCIVYFQMHIGAVWKSSVEVVVLLIHNRMFPGNFQKTSIRHCLSGIGAYVHHYLLDLIGIGKNQCRLFSECTMKLNA